MGIPAQSMDGSSPPTIHMVARSAGVSTATVSYVLSGKADQPGGARVGEATRERVRLAAQQLGYRVNGTARALRTGKSGIVLMRHARISDPAAHILTEMAYRAFEPFGLTLLVLPEADWSSFLDNNFVDVAYLDSVDASGDEVGKLATLAERGMKIIVNDPAVEPNGFDVIRINHTQALQLMMDHLAKYRRIGFIGIANQCGDASLEQIVAYQDSHDLPTRPGWNVLIHSEGYNSGFDAALQVLSGLEPPRALLFHNDQLAAEAIHAARFLGLRVPEDVAIAGLGNTPMARRFHPRITTAGPTGSHLAIVDRMVQFATGFGLPPGLLHTQSAVLNIGESA